MEHCLDQLRALVIEKNGLVFTRDVSSLGVPRAYIKNLVDSGELVQLERGVYLASNAFDDEMFRIQVRYPKAVFSHDTALYLHDLTDRDPIKYSITVPSGFNAQRLSARGVTTFYINLELFSLGLTNGNTMSGRVIRLYNPERTVCDVLRNRSSMDIALVTDAVKRYAVRRDRNLPVLMNYAKIFRVEKLLRNYLEVLL